MTNGEPQGTPPPYEPELRAQRPWRRRYQAWAAMVWSSFLVAAVATMLFFAFFDPALLEPAMSYPMDFSRMAGYTAGFFFFWFITAMASALTGYLIRSSHRDLRYDDAKESSDE